MFRRAVPALVAILAMVVGCAPSTPPPPPAFALPEREFAPDFAGAPALPPPDLTDDGPGSLVQVTPVDDMDEFQTGNATAIRILYSSTASDGSPTQVSGVVAVPPGEPPSGGWPIMAFGHDLTGTGELCAPSFAQGFSGYAAVMSAVLASGYVVVLSDYQGLGVTGYQHSTVDAAALGNNLIDGARAVRRAVPEASARWAAFGLGEGGLAAWSAAERAGIYGAGMDLVGAAAISPYADLSDLADAAAVGGLAGPEQFRLSIFVLQSLANADPQFDLDAQRSTFARDNWDVLTDCAPKDPEAAKQLFAQLGPNDLRSRDPAAAEDLRRRLRSAALPAPYPTPGSAPVLVTFATGDLLIPPAGTQRALLAACAKGERVEVVQRIGDTKTDYESIQNSLLWLQARFDGQGLANVCIGAA